MDNLTLYMRRCVNEDELFWDHLYSVYLGGGYCPIEIIVNANYMGDAIDFAMDYTEEQGWKGLWLTDNEVIELEEYGEVGYFGNHGLPVAFEDINVVQRY